MSDAQPLPDRHPLVDGRTAEAPLVLAYQGIRPSRRPVWFMRQAGRSLPEYREARKGIPMLEACLMPELAARITVQPVSRHGVDAAIFFSDIVVPLKLAGVGVDIVAGIGPVMDAPVRSLAEVRALPRLDPGSLAPITTAVGLSVAELGTTPLIGFAGAPFTLASYLVEGGPSSGKPHTRAMMREDPHAWHELLGWIAELTGEFLRAQVLAGASAIQLFDSWVGTLTAGEYLAFAAPHSRTVMDLVSDLPVSRVHFGTGTGHLLTQMRDVGATVIGVDQFTPLDEANAQLGGTTPLQGNIDPGLLASGWDVVAAHVREVMRRGQRAPAHVVNLGHGVPKDADPDVLTRIVRLVHDVG
ncbi:MAG: uroporphyrinogen decarboxylase [Candidatus Nanopelagicales bacterium]